MSKNEEDLEAVTTTLPDDEKAVAQAKNEDLYRYTFEVSERFYDRMQRETRRYKHERNIRVGKNTWIVEAIREKLDRAASSKESYSQLPRFKSVQVVLPKEIAADLRDQVNLLREQTGKGSIKNMDRGCYRRKARKH